MKHYLLSITLLFLAGLLAAQAPYGIYKMQDGKLMSIAEIDGNSFMVYDNGALRGLRAAATADTFEVGNTLGLFEEIEGQLQFAENGTVTWKKKQGAESTGTKMKFVDREVTFKNGKTTLAGTLILPDGSGTYPCIVFTHGSGAETREGSRGLANLFVANGIAVLIYDKRGTGKSTGKDWQDSFDNYAGDAVAGAEFLKSQPDINNKQIGIYGHSQGGWITPLAVSKSTLFSFAIISAANAITPVEQHLLAGDEEYRLLGMDEATLKEVHSFRQLKYQVGITGKGKDEYVKKYLPEAEKKSWFKTTGGSLPESPFWKVNGFYDPAPALKSMMCPVLVIYGTMDISTNTQRNLPLMRELLGSKPAEFKVFENTNHMMMKVDKKGYAIKQLPAVTQFADGYLDALVEWTKKVVNK